MIGDDLRKTVKDQGCKSQLSNFIRSCGLSTSKGIAGGDTPRRNGSPALSAVMIARSANTCKHLSMGLLCELGNQAASSLCVKLSLVIRCPCWLRQGSPGRSQFFSRIAPQVSGPTTGFRGAYYSTLVRSGIVSRSPPQESKMCTMAHRGMKDMLPNGQERKLRISQLAA